MNYMYIDYRLDNFMGNQRKFILSSIMFIDINNQVGLLADFGMKGSHLCCKINN